MKNTTLLKIASIAFITFIFVSCNKYEEGSNFSLLTAKMRLTNTWTQTGSLYTNGSSSTTNTGYTDFIVTFDKDETYTYTGKVLGFNVSESGTWKFNSDKTAVVLTQNPSEGNDVQTWTIIKLKNKELSVESIPSNGGTLRLDFDAK